MRSFVIESNGNFLGEIRAGSDSIDTDSRPVVMAEYSQNQRLVQIVGVTAPEGETLTPPNETEPVKAMVYYGVRV
ncbi:MAG: hypothetical protein ACO22U_17020 [bacterium]